MPTIKLTERSIARLKAPDPSGKQTLHWDEDLKGFGVLCSGTTNAKAYVCQRNIAGRNRRVTIAAVNEIALKDARDQAAATLLAMRQGIDPKAKTGKVTFRQAFEDYLRSSTRLKENSIAIYQTIVTTHLADWMDLPLREITADAVTGKHLAIEGKAIANLVFKVFRAVWNLAAERDPTLPPNPCRSLRRQWHAIPRRERFVKFEELPKFVEAVRELENPVVRDYLLLLLFTGLRRREAALLTWEDIDFVGGVIRIPASATKSGRKLDLPMSDLVKDVLVARRSVGREKYVFPAASRSRHIEQPRGSFLAIAAKIGVEYSPHDLRRTFVTVAESADISPMALKALVAHTLGSGLTEGYVIMSVERLREAAQKVADRMRALCEIEAPTGVDLLRC